jgi:hypothetical protein
MILPLDPVLEEALLPLGVQICKLLLHLLSERLLHLRQGELQCGFHGSLTALESSEVVVGEIQNRNESDTKLLGYKPELNWRRGRTASNKTRRIGTTTRLISCSNVLQYCS